MIIEAPAYILEFTERQFQDFIVAAAVDNGWTWYHTRDSRGSIPGFPDLVLVKADRPILFYEVKTEKRRASMVQQDWLHRINHASGSARAMLVRPSDWDAIAAELAT